METLERKDIGPHKKIIMVYMDSVQGYVPLSVPADWSSDRITEKVEKTFGPAVNNQPRKWITSAEYDERIAPN